jgi:hypothetical protein
MTHKEFADGLREFAEFIELHEEIPVPSGQTFHANARDIDKAAQRAHAAMVAKAFGHSNKEEYEQSMQITHRFNAVVKMEVWYDRDALCERVELERKIIPAVPETTIVKPAVPEHEEIVYGWKCAPILKEKKAVSA